MASERPDGQEVENTHTLVAPLADFGQANFRTDGLKKLQAIGAPTPGPIYVVPHNTFELYRQNPKETLEKLRHELKDLASVAASKSKKGTIAVRRAYDIPGIDNPRGRSFLGVPPEEVTTAIKNLFDDAVEYGYIQYDGAQIACFFYPFIDPENKPLEEVSETDVLPCGGWLVPISEDGHRLKVLATWGNNQTLIWYNEQARPIETYEVEIDMYNRDRVLIHDKKIVPKPYMHYTPKDGTSAIVDVPSSHQLQQVIWDSEIIKIASYLPKLISEYGPQRVEFSSDGEEIFFNESVDMTREIQEMPEKIAIEGSVLVVRTMEELKRLDSYDDDELKQIVIFAADTATSSQVNVSLARNFEGKNLTILYAGASVTAHAMKVFLNCGHHAFAVGQLDLRENDIVSIKSEGNGNPPIVENLTLNARADVVPLSEAHKREPYLVGGKASRLSFIKSHGYNVPEGVVVTTNFFDGLLKESGADQLLENLSFSPPQDTQDIERAIRQRLNHIPEQQWQQLEEFFRRCGIISGKKLIVRSSANVEDARQNSFAGIFESLHSDGTAEDIKRAMLECYCTAFSPKVVSYLSNDLPRLREIKLSLIVQELVDVRCAGVIFGGDARTKRSEVTRIEASRGFAIDIVEGKGADLRLTKNRVTDQTTAEGEDILSKEEKSYLFRLAEVFEELFGYPQDIEWCIDKGGKFWIVQSRDL